MVMYEAWARERGRQFGAAGRQAPRKRERAQSVGALANPCKAIKGFVARAISAAAVIASPPVDEETRTIRLVICKAHVGNCCSVGPDGRHYCGCCGCPQWHAFGVGADLEFKTGRAKWGCPRWLYGPALHKPFGTHHGQTAEAHVVPIP